MKSAIQKIFQESIAVKQKTFEKNADPIAQAVEAIVATFKAGGKVLIFGNGGSAADSQHIAAEFVGRFKKERRALAAIALTTDTSILTALGNDYSFDIVFARQIEALGTPKDFAWGISTSGNSPNVIEGIKKAKAMGMRTIVLTGGDGGRIKPLSDVALIVPSKITARIQESHICIAHCICELVEENFSGSR